MVNTFIRSSFLQPCRDPVDMFRQRQCSVYNNRTIDPLLPLGVRFEPKYNGKYQLDSSIERLAISNVNSIEWKYSNLLI